MHKQYPFGHNHYVDVWYCDEQCCQGMKLHRPDGPAYVNSNGYKEWWIHGRQLLGKELEEKLEQELQDELSVYRNGLPYPIRYDGPFVIRRKPPEKKDKPDGDG